MHPWLRSPEYVDAFVNTPLSSIAMFCPQRCCKDGDTVARLLLILKQRDTYPTSPLQAAAAAPMTLNPIWRDSGSQHTADDEDEVP